MKYNIKKYQNVFSEDSINGGFEIFRKRRR